MQRCLLMKIHVYPPRLVMGPHLNSPKQILNHYFISVVQDFLIYGIVRRPTRAPRIAHSSSACHWPPGRRSYASYIQGNSSSSHTLCCISTKIERNTSKELGLSLLSSQSEFCWTLLVERRGSSLVGKRQCL